MGTCFGKCSWNFGPFKSSASHNSLDENLIDENVQNGAIFQIMKFKRKRFRPKLFNKLLRKRAQADESNGGSNYAELGEENRLKKHMDISLQCLDARSLLMINREERVGQYRDLHNTNTSSQYSSSLDLEWEHEYGAGGAPSTNPAIWINIDSELGGGKGEDDASRQSLSDSSSEKKDNSVECSKKSQFHAKANSWSHISTPDSMEWDVDQDEQLKSEAADSIDQDTKDLLYEIEQLKNRVLKETGNFEYLNEFQEFEDS